MTRIFVVDDEPSYRDSLERILSYEGYEVRTAADAISALEVAASYAPDLLIVDWMLRGDQTGLDVAQAILESNPKLRTIVISGYVTPRLIAKVKRIDGASMLAKPFGINDLLPAVEDAIDQPSSEE